MSTPFTSNLRNTLSGLVFVAGAFAATTHAQSSRQQVRVTVPFAFQDGTAHMNPGVYTLALQSDHIMVVRGARGSTSALSLVDIGETVKPAAAGKVVFHKYGDRYFLREVWMSGSSTHLECPKTKAEKNLQRELQLAVNTQPANGTEVALLELPH